MLGQQGRSFERGEIVTFAGTLRKESGGKGTEVLGALAREGDCEHPKMLDAEVLGIKTLLQVVPMCPDLIPEPRLRLRWAIRIQERSGLCWRPTILKMEPHPIEFADPSECLYDSPVFYKVPLSASNVAIRRGRIGRRILRNSSSRSSV